MILLQTHRACWHCPISLMCLGGYLASSVSARTLVNMRHCRRCGQVYFTVGNQQYLCVRLDPEVRQEIHRIADGCMRNPDVGSCLEHHDDDFTARY